MFTVLVHRALRRCNGASFRLTLVPCRESPKVSHLRFTPWLCRLNRLHYRRRELMSTKPVTVTLRRAVVRGGSPIPGHEPVFEKREGGAPDHSVLIVYVKRRGGVDRKSTRLNSSHRCISYAVFCLK